MSGLVRAIAQDYSLIKEDFADGSVSPEADILVLVAPRNLDQAASALIEALDEPDSETRIYALMALGSLGDPRAEAPLSLALADEDPGIRKTAAYALGELGQRSAKAAPHSRQNFARSGFWCPQLVQFTVPAPLPAASRGLWRRTRCRGGGLHRDCCSL